MTTEIEILLDIAQSRDKMAHHGGGRVGSCEDRQKGYKFRKLARTLRNDGGNELSEFSEDELELALEVLESVSSDGSLFSEEQDAIETGAEKLGAVL